MSGLSTGATIGGGLGAGVTAAAAAGSSALAGTTLELGQVLLVWQHVLLLVVLLDCLRSS